ncbi:hypothetical protein [Streptacidiphilus sp. EB103A]|uniref:hypothetical protein n=1 Tax=Streptacidiphilus sp. EB103A TaxID=3156275 RepID=UPI003515AB3E
MSNYSAERHQAHLDTIRRALDGLIPGAVSANLKVKVTETLHEHPDGVQSFHTWEGPSTAVAERVFTALYGQAGPDLAPSSPVEQAAAAKSARDLGGEIGALMAGADDLANQAWYPPRPGDLIHLAYEGSLGLTAHGETYAVTQTAETSADFMDMSLLHSSYPDSPFAGCYAVSMDPDPLMEMWMEAGSYRLTVVRDGVVVHNGPTRVVS